MDMTLCALEYLYFLNAYESAPLQSLEQSLERVDSALDRLVEIERVEYGLRACELVPETAPVDCEPQRGILLLLKVSILNALGRFQESVIHLNWMMDHRQQMVSIKWIVPHTFWYMFFSKKKKKKKKKEKGVSCLFHREIGITSWHLEQRTQALAFWETALKYKDYEFEHRLTMASRNPSIIVHWTDLL
jgi:tetratricopeptide (TPR) repeat protein